MDLEHRFWKLYEQSRIRLQIKFQEEYDNQSSREELEEESLDMEIYDVDIDDEVYNQTNQDWEFDEPEEIDEN